MLLENHVSGGLPVFEQQLETGQLIRIAFRLPLASEFVTRVKGQVDFRMSINNPFLDFT